jgi:hypothetical protein
VLICSATTLNSATACWHGDPDVMRHRGLVNSKLKLSGLSTSVFSFSLFFSGLDIEPFTFPTGGPLGAIAKHRGLHILAISEVIITKIFMQSVFSGLRLVVKLMHSAESLSIQVHSLAS